MNSRWPVSVLAGTAFAFVLLRALLTPDLYWDTLAYHWPYAARAAGLCDRGCQRADIIKPSRVLAAYFRLGGPKLDELVNDTMPVVAAVNDGETLCVLKKDRRAFLYAPVFHPGRRHRTVLLENNEPNNECTKWVDLK